MASGETAPDLAVSGYVLSESIALSTFPAGASYSWGISKPSGGTVRSDLSNASIPAPVVSPDVAGYYVVTCNVDGFAYVLRISVSQVAVTTPYESIRFMPLTDAQVPAPTMGVALYFSSTQNKLAIKHPDNSVSVVNVTP